jgi:ribosomal protein S17
MRIIHRYLDFFLAGIMAVYSISGIVMIFRNTDTFKVEHQNEKTIEGITKIEDLGRQLRIRDFKIEKEEGDIIYFKNGS